MSIDQHAPIDSDAQLAAGELSGGKVWGCIIVLGGIPGGVRGIVQENTNKHTDSFWPAVLLSQSAELDINIKP